ncbi:MAG: cytochrome C assembly protein [Phycisphaera sp.]|nr:cytochrome C assembly protein [Phycisphaera sp.]
MQKASELQAQAVLADQTPQDQRDAYQGKVLQLSNQLALYQSLRGMDAIRLVPTDSVPGEWAPIHFVSQAGGGSTRSARIADGYRQLFVAYRDRDASRFNSLTHSLRDMMRLDHRALTDRARLEAAFNRYGVFFRASVLYLVIGLMTMVCWLRWQRVLHGAAFALLVVVLGVHTLGLGMRVYLSGRPPVTNLYSSALFIGWGVAVLCVILEYLHRNTMGLVVAAAAGFTTLLIAQGLSGNGDSMAVLQAVLDTNFWLATHVVVITLGYSATYLAGLLGVAYIFRGVFTRSLGEADSKQLAQMIYGVICFATLFSFVGTILGGIWADQSWGRFWGWDPKENGALVIVLWNALVLHARWGGLVRHRGIAVLAVFGNVVTSWSWFGVNMLGRGLHSYGFIDSAAWWLAIFVVSQLLVIGIGGVPERLWRSRSKPVGSHRPIGTPAPTGQGKIAALNAE